MALGFESSLRGGEGPGQTKVPLQSPEAYCNYVLQGFVIPVHLRNFLAPLRAVTNDESLGRSINALSCNWAQKADYTMGHNHFALYPCP